MNKKAMTILRITLMWVTAILCHQLSAAYYYDDSDEYFEDEDYVSYHDKYDYKLGSRTLKPGDFGSDVGALWVKLKSAGYVEEYIVDKRMNQPVYSGYLVVAVKHFQKDVGIKTDGIVTGKMVRMLEAWDPACTSIELGSRVLDADGTCSGSDVDDLVELLTRAGYPPQKNLLKKTEAKPLSKEESSALVFLLFEYTNNYFTNYRNKKSHYIFTDDIRTALMAFQAFNGIEPTGFTDYFTVKKLKTYEKRP